MTWALVTYGAVGWSLAVFLGWRYRQAKRAARAAFGVVLEWERVWDEHAQYCAAAWLRTEARRQVREDLH